MPASHFFEFTGAKYPKTRWRFTLKGEDWFCFAGLWRPEQAGGGRFALLTTSPGPDMAAYPDRQPVVLGKGHWAAWLGEGVPAQDVLRPSPAGMLQVEEAPRG